MENRYVDYSMIDKVFIIYNSKHKFIDAVPFKDVAEKYTNENPGSFFEEIEIVDTIINLDDIEDEDK